MTDAKPVVIAFAVILSLAFCAYYLAGWRGWVDTKAPVAAGRGTADASLAPPLPAPSARPAN